jgi:stage III sporulation protein AG
MEADRKEKFENLVHTLKKNKFVILILLLGVILLMLPSKSDDTSAEETDEEKSDYSIENTTTELKEILSLIDGAGKVEVMLSASGTSERILASDSEVSESESGGENNSSSNSDSSVSTVIVSTGSGTSDAVTVKYVYPEFRGAIVVAQGADSASVKLAITQAVASITGLPASSITVIKMK